jgi:hypothetical protein
MTKKASIEQVAPVTSHSAENSERTLNSLISLAKGVAGVQCSACGQIIEGEYNDDHGVNMHFVCPDEINLGSSAEHDLESWLQVKR